MQKIALSLMMILTLGIASQSSAQFRPQVGPMNPNVRLMNTNVPKGFQRYATPRSRWFMPPNNLHLRRFRESATQITEPQFNQIIDDVMKLFVPIAASKGAKLTVEKRWDDETVNAYADETGNDWQVHMFGGLARQPEMTPDGFVLVLCHELGHHFGGYPFVDSNAWAANEGQSDYFATDVCAKAVWSRDFRGNAGFRALTGVPPVIQQQCGTAWPNNTNAQGWCVRAAAAGQALANVLGALGGPGSKPPSPMTPDTTVVKVTDPHHPQAQCRLDTYIAGALCTKAWNPGVMPARGFPGGEMTPAAEMESSKYVCTEKEGFKLGVRPRCWFAPLVN